jgi:hypothetical protein
LCQPISGSDQRFSALSLGLHSTQVGGQIFLQALFNQPDRHPDAALNR